MEKVPTRSSTKKEKPSKVSANSLYLVIHSRQSTTTNLEPKEN